MHICLQVIYSQKKNHRKIKRECVRQPVAVLIKIETISILNVKKYELTSKFLLMKWLSSEAGIGNGIYVKYPLSKGRRRAGRRKSITTPSPTWKNVCSQNCNSKKNNSKFFYFVGQWQMTHSQLQSLGSGWESWITAIKRGHRQPKLLRAIVK